MAAVGSETYTSVSAPIQYAAVQAFRGGVEIERYLWHARRILSTLGRRCTRTLAEAGICVHPPDGAFYLFLDFSPLRDVLLKRGITTGAALCDRLLAETGVALLPGSAFGRSRTELTARLAYVDFDGAAALAASENIPLDQELPYDFPEHWCNNVIEGKQRIAAWIHGDLDERATE
jgi:aspartate aminotransferase